MPALHPSLEPYRHVISLPVQWGDMDSFGHVNNTLYLRWAESARIDYFIRARLWSPAEPLVIGPILAHLSCNYRIPVEYPDTVHVGTRVSHMGNSSFRMTHVIVSAAHHAVAADLDSTLVFYDYGRSKPTRLPDEIRSVINALES